MGEQEWEGGCASKHAPLDEFVRAELLVLRFLLVWRARAFDKLDEREVEATQSFRSSALYFEMVERDLGHADSHAVVPAGGHNHQSVVHARGLRKRKGCTYKAEVATFYKDYVVIRNAQQQARLVPMRHVAGTWA